MAKDRRFSIQKHEAIEIHYLLNLETREGIYSWAIPGGPSHDPRLKRLAFPVTNAVAIDFEGLDGTNTFAGDVRKRVIVWDSGTYNTYEFEGSRLSASESVRVGRLEFSLNGQKVKGGFTLLKVEEAPNERWILMKTLDDNASTQHDPVVTEPKSVVSGRSLEQLTGDFSRTEINDLEE